jgi:putative flippase GtrA
MRPVLKFWLVGALGFVVQLATLAALTSILRWPWLFATIASVECAIVHNFLWHERWTWKGGRSRFGRFNAANGLSSIAGNIIVTGIFVRLFHLPVVAANAVAVVVMSAINFIVADRWVFAALLLLVPSSASAAPTPSALQAWNDYVARTEARLAAGSAAGVSMPPERIVAAGDTIDVGAATISDWRGAVFVPHTTVAGVLRRLEWPGTPPPQDDVAASRVLAREPGRLCVYMRLVRHAIVTVTYDTEHDMRFERRSASLATARSVATRIDEVGGGDHGFLWRLNSYWRYEQQGDGVLITLESLTLSRDVPALIKPIAGRIVPRIARDSMVRTLDALEKYLRHKPEAQE